MDESSWKMDQREKKEAGTGLLVGAGAPMVDVEGHGEGRKRPARVPIHAADDKE